jgi:general secretion pathway protein C
VFYDAGLQNGDIAVEMNGYDLTNTFQAMKLMGEFQNLKKIDIVVLRDETRRNITLDLE